MERLDLSPREQTLLDKIDKVDDEYNRRGEEVIALVQKDRLEEANEGDTLGKAFARMAGKLSEMTSVRVAERSVLLLLDLVPSIRKTASMVQQVAASSTNQASGVGQINATIIQVDQVTQRSASSSEELSSTAEEMSSQAEALQQLMSFFRVAGGGGDARAASHSYSYPPPDPPLSWRAGDARAQQRPPTRSDSASGRGAPRAERGFKPF